MSKCSVFTATFTRSGKSLTVDGLIGCIENAKKECLNSDYDWEIVTFFNEEENKMLPTKMTFMRDMFSNGYSFAMKESEY